MTEYLQVCTVCNVCVVNTSSYGSKIVSLNEMPGVCVCVCVAYIYVCVSIWRGPWGHSNLAQQSRTVIISVLSRWSDRRTGRKVFFCTFSLSHLRPPLCRHLTSRVYFKHGASDFSELPQSFGINAAEVNSERIQVKRDRVPRV